MSNVNPYAGAIVLVTGGASGIGAAVARRFAAYGSHVIIADIAERLGATVASEIGAKFVRADVGEVADNQRIFDTALAEFGRLDVVHLNAGIIGSTSIGETFDLRRYRKVVSVNLDSVVFGVQAAVPLLRASGGGSIIVTASAAALRPSIEVFYSATKCAAIGLVRSLAPVLAADKITINALCPGLVDTPLIESRRSAITAAGVAVASAELVADAVEVILAGAGTGQAWLAMADREVAPFEFTDLPVPGAEKLSYSRESFG